MLNFSKQVKHFLYQQMAFQGKNVSTNTLIIESIITGYNISAGFFKGIGHGAATFGLAGRFGQGCFVYSLCVSCFGVQDSEQTAYGVCNSVHTKNLRQSSLCESLRGIFHHLLMEDKLMSQNECNKTDMKMSFHDCVRAYACFSVFFCDSIIATHVTAIYI